MILFWLKKYFLSCIFIITKLQKRGKIALCLMLYVAVRAGSNYKFEAVGKNLRLFKGSAEAQVCMSRKHVHVHIFTEIVTPAPLELVRREWRNCVISLACTSSCLSSSGLLLVSNRICCFLTTAAPYLISLGHSFIGILWYSSSEIM